MFDIVKIKENEYRTVFDVTADSGNYQVIVSNYNEAHIRKFDDDNMLDGEATFDWNREKIDKMIEDFYAVVKMMINNNFD